MIGMNTNFIATVGTLLDTVERGKDKDGNPIQRHSLRAAVRMPKRNKNDEDYGTQWVTLNFFPRDAEYARTKAEVGGQAVVTGKLRTAQGDDGRTFFDIDVSDVTFLPKRKKDDDSGEGQLDW